METTKYERAILDTTREFATTNDIQFTKMTELIIINTIRKVKADDDRILLDLLHFTNEIRTNAKKNHKENNDKNYYEGEFVASEAIIEHIKQIAGLKVKRKWAI